MEHLNGTNPLQRYEIASGATVAEDALVALNTSGQAVPASATANLTVVGGGRMVRDGEVEVEDGILALDNDNGSGGSAVTRAMRGKPCYVKDSKTVTAAYVSSTCCVAGIVVDVVDSGAKVYVDTRPAAVCAGKAYHL